VAGMREHYLSGKKRLAGVGLRNFRQRKEDEKFDRKVCLEFRVGDERGGVEVCSKGDQRRVERGGHTLGKEEIPKGIIYQMGYQGRHDDKKWRRTYKKKEKIRPGQKRKKAAHELNRSIFGEKGGKENAA